MHAAIKRESKHGLEVWTTSVVYKTHTVTSVSLSLAGARTWLIRELNKGVSHG